MWSLLMMFACGSAPEPPSAPTAPAPVVRGRRTDTDVEGLAAALAQGATLLDVRTPEEYAQGHVPGARNVPLGSFTPSTTDPALQGLDPEVPTYVICASGGRSSKAADELASGGFTVVNVNGGTQAWRAAGKPVEP